MIEALDLWLSTRRRREKPQQHALGVRHVMLAICDELRATPDANPHAARAYLDRWTDATATLRAEFRDADGAAPRHTFFAPLEQSDTALATSLAAVCRATDCETEIDLADENRAGSGDEFAENLARLSAHDLLSRDAEAAVRFGVIRGASAPPLAALVRAGCYADFTPPAVPPRHRASTSNALFYARTDDPLAAADRGRRVRAARETVRLARETETARQDDLLVVQSPHALDWTRPRLGFLPRIERALISVANPPARERLRLWLDCRIAVEGRPNWLFIKLHTRGAAAENSDLFSGKPLHAFYRALAAIAAEDHTMRFHFVTARELVNIVHAAEAGHSGEPGLFRDFRYRLVDAAAENSA